jgi:ABC-2 type transport system permease protein
MPFVQLVILANAATFELKNLNILFVDKDKSSFSRQLTSKFEGSKYFNVTGYSFDTKTAEEELNKRNIDIYIEIPQNFEKTLIRDSKNEINLVANAIDGMKGSLASFYSNNILHDFLNDKSKEYIIKGNMFQKANEFHNVEILYSNWFNTEMSYKFLMVPGLLVLLVTLIGTVLSAINIVREKEIGTIESINVTPIKKYEFISAKLIPIWIIGMFEMVFGLVIALLLYDIPIIGSPIVLFTFAALYLFVPLGFGLLISTITETQQQSMLLSWFFLVVFILLSGFFTAIENMPDWARAITYFNPVRYFIEVIRMVMLKGSGFAEIKVHLIVIAIMGVLVNSLAVWRYRKTA